MSHPLPRSPFAVTLAVWNALLLREAVARMFSRRGALAWLLLEPVAHILLVTLVFTVIRIRHIGGMDIVLWIALGKLAFALFQRAGMRSANAVGANQALFTYRQVKPVDTVLVRCVLEGMLMVLVAAITLALIAMWRGPIPASDPMEIAAASLGLWLLGVGWALGVAVATELVPEVENVLSMLSFPLMLLSGVMIPLASIPMPWREWLMLNPIAHGIEGIRAGVSPLYHHAPELSLPYLYGWALGMVFLGLALQARFQRKVVSL